MGIAHCSPQASGLLSQEIYNLPEEVVVQISFELVSFSLDICLANLTEARQRSRCFETVSPVPQDFGTLSCAKMSGNKLCNVVAENCSPFERKSGPTVVGRI